MTIPAYQERIKHLVKELGFDEETVSDKFLLLVEEVGEFAKAARKSQNIKTHKGSKEHDPGEEAADILWYLMDICNQLGIDLDGELEAKIIKNQKREWR